MCSVGAIESIGYVVGCDRLQRLIPKKRTDFRVQSVGEVGLQSYLKRQTISRLCAVVDFNQIAAIPGATLRTRAAQTNAACAMPPQHRCSPDYEVMVY